jgi:hypothetical protein
VQVRIEPRTYPVQANDRSNWPPVPKLLGKDKYFVSTDGGGERRVAALL